MAAILAAIDIYGSWRVRQCAARCGRPSWCPARYRGARAHIGEGLVSNHARFEILGRFTRDVRMLVHTSRCISLA